MIELVAVGLVLAWATSTAAVLRHLTRRTMSSAPSIVTVVEGDVVRTTQRFTLGAVRAELFGRRPT